MLSFNNKNHVFLFARHDIFKSSEFAKKKVNALCNHAILKQTTQTKNRYKKSTLILSFIISQYLKISSVQTV